ncbi:hypothetical protein LH392_00785 [Corynebacterium uberis]|uniref:hypothetical protein n=1 Tax=Corynebacterium TaxID=1716 RepID=UPI001D0BC063|nr:MULTISPECIES: hypothetical protein [Corynebacterium]MCZ9309839.1 hypothetical protein [Corynebacterium sp. c6VSa_13]UDL75890.1 hypothetical protein LH393_00360 [Corynebacterium uberis]UDL78102.1 hypothetical protein LH394_00355 [Corynebacterium uberis]UDL80385.1 hypothetical protein LH392_00785 [Corynebacterium uberis]UDL84727.1 hypothetical protein LH390_00360 [Corynebacterium uberis]
MREHKLTSLIFGNVVIESMITGAQVRLYSEDLRSYYYRPTPHAEISMPLDELREKITKKETQELAEVIFDSVSEELEANYPGGLERAKREFMEWLTL